ncbi:twin-arginine translocation signal domain-containing protein [Streptomyces sp. N50]|uniref:twin-arginine translocation signal domain-containing protein n=1 Tax=Streptomyces sp. N50 TaxID=3081765 RepID=UPI0029623022|nr:twin-arginine translocation signal domain-containing protein [Streptomyces sp. N50]WOX10813.1 twin-arginine translocation signal domain-containing protein [Streptomyces sp. N50]
MVDRRRFIVGSGAVGALAVLGTTAACTAKEAEGEAVSETSSATGHVRGATAITQVYGDGQKLIAVAVEYDTDITGSALSTSTFKVAGRTVTKVYANREPSLAAQGRNGRYVIVEMSPDDRAAALWVTQQGSGNASSSSPSTSPKASSSPTASSSSGSGQAPGGGGPKVGDSTPGGTIVAAKATLTQTGTVTTTGGTRYPASTTGLTTDAVKNLIVDDFRQFTFTDPATRKTLKYNLFIPKGYDRDHHKSYPLVLFMHDASVVNVATEGPLVQGLGAVCWASPEDQARHEAFVLAPEYDSVVIDDTYRPSPLFDATAHLVQELTKKYNLDEKRLYATGQSMGAMMTLGLNIKYPDLFGASFVVAGQWPADQAKPLAKKKLWIVVSQDDDKSYSGENAITKVVKEQGTAVGTAVWNGRSTAARFAADVRSLKAQKAPVNYASFKTGTVVPAGSTTSAHMATWQVAYTIPGIREWVMDQSL